MRKAPALALVLAACGGAVDGPAGDTAEPATGARAAVPPLDLVLEDATLASGIRFVPENGATGEKLLPETMGAGVCILDYDGDGELDLFLVGGHRWDGAPTRSTCALYRGHGDGTFEDVTEAAGIALSVYGMGASAADYDGDGDEDLFVTALEDDVLLENRGGRFADVTSAAAVGGGRWKDAAGVEHPEWSTAAAWLDADGDGDLDLFVAKYVQWTPSEEIFTTLDGVHKAFTTPDRYVGLPCRLYLNQGGGRFRETPLAGADGEALRGKALGVALWDFDGDGGLDLAVANDTRPNFFFQSRGGGRYEERGAELGLAYDEDGRARAGMGIDVADLGDDEGVVVAIGNFAGEPLSLYRASASGAFRSDALASGVARATVAPLAFGLSFLDLDLDGRQDLVVVDGHIEPDVARERPGESYAQPPQLFRGLPGGRFEDVSADVGPDWSVPRVGRGLAAGDLDGDGDLDLVITVSGGLPVVLLNRAQERRPRAYLRVELVGPPENPRALGATLTFASAERVQRRTVRTGSSYLSQGELVPFFGRGAGPGAAGTLEVRWPDGRRERFAVAPADRRLRLAEGSGEPLEGTRRN